MELLSLPEDIQFEIFKRLPAKSISICRCVCKICYTVLSNPKFVNSLLIRTSNNPRLMVFKIPHAICKKPIDLVYSVDYDSLLTVPTSDDCENYSSELGFLTSDECESNGGAIQMMDYPFHNEYVSTYRVLGSCNGLFCFGTAGQTTYFWIWNPTTREYKKISGPTYESPVDQFIRYGFGHDSQNDDYKIVMILRYKTSPGCSKALVYTLKSDSWNYTNNNPVSYSFRRACEKYGRKCGLLFHGALHWIGKSQRTASEVIASFDISTETLVDVPLLEEIKKLDKHVGVLGDCLCLAVAVEDTRFDVWVMRDYGVAKSWSKKFTITHGRVHHFTTRNSFFKPIWSFENGKFLIESRKDLMLYDQTNGGVRMINIPINTGMRCRRGTLLMNGESYVESLVSLKSGTYVEKITTTVSIEKSVRRTLVIFQVS